VLSTVETMTSLAIQDVLAATAGVLEEAGSTVALTGVSIDSRTANAGDLFIAIAGPRFDGHDFVGDAARRGAAAAMVHHAVEAPAGVPLVRVADTTRALGELARYVRLLSPAAVVGITGSAGKTTTKEMTARILSSRGPVLKTEGNLNNQYGLPLTLLRLEPEHRFAVLEMGMSAAGELRHLTAIARPDVAVIVGVAAVHLEFFESVEAIAAAKAEILEGLRPGGAAVLNGDDPRVRQIGEGHRGEVVWFGRDRRFEVSAENWRGTVHGMRFDLRVGGRTVDVALPLAGPHFLTNFLAAAAAAHRLGVDPDEMASAALDMKAAPHRGQVIVLGSGVTLLDDSYNSNPTAVDHAVTALSLAGGQRRVAFLGDMLELGPRAADLHREIGEGLAGRVDVVVGVGALARALVDGARSAGVDPNLLHVFADSAAAARAASRLVEPGDAVLVKGSRGVRMEAVVQALSSRFGARER